MAKSDKKLAQERAYKAFALRLAGAPHKTIAEQLGYSSTASVRAALKRVGHIDYEPEGIQEMRALQSARIDEGIRVCAQLFEAQNPLMRIQAVHEYTSLLKRQAELFGLDIPVPPAEANAATGHVIIREYSKEVLDGVRGLIAPPRSTNVDTD